MAEPDDPDYPPTKPWGGREDAPTIPATPPPAAGPSPNPRGGWQPPTPEELQPSFPQYEIREVIGRGGMGAVYKGWQKSLRRFVAIKILPPQLEDSDANFTERFQREAQAMARFAHPGIVSVYDAGETTGGLLYFVMEYIEGSDVGKIVATQGRLPQEHALSITAHVCDALAYAHRRGVIHRDIKPSNIMVDADGQVKVADFGLAKVATDDSAALLTGTHLRMGTPDFMAPESMMGIGKIDHRADLYAVGVMLYQMLTGHLPRGRFDPPSRRVPGLDVRFDAIIDQALQNDPDRRYSSATEIRTDLDRITTGPVSVSSASPPEVSAGGARLGSAGFVPSPSQPAVSPEAPTAPLASIRHPRRATKRIYGGGAAAILVALVGWALFKMGWTLAHRPPVVAVPNGTAHETTPDPARAAPSGERPLAQTTPAIPAAAPAPAPISRAPAADEQENRFEELVIQAKQLRERGDLNAAIASFREAAIIDSNNPLPLAELAGTYERMGLADKAAVHWRKIYEMGGGAGIYYALAEAKLKAAQAFNLGNATGQSSGNPVDTAQAIDGIAAGAVLGLRQVTTEEQRDDNSAKRFILHLPIEARPKVRIEVRDLVIHVLFYDIVDGQNVVQTSANVNSRWATPPADWVDSNTEELAVEYQLPKSTVPGGARENRKYFGYIVRIYYKQQLQASVAEPVRLAQQYPPPPILPKESDQPGASPANKSVQQNSASGIPSSPTGQSAYRTAADFAGQAMKIRETAISRMEPQAIVPTTHEVFLASSLTWKDYEWSKPQNLGPGVNSAEDEYAFGMSDDGLVLVLSSTRNGSRHLFECRRERVDQPFGKAELIGEFRPGVESDPFVSGDGLTLLFASRPNASGNANIYESQRASRADHWGSASRLFAPGSYNAGPCLSADKLTLWFQSNREGGYGGFDLWRSTRSAVGSPFEQPENLGGGVNTEADECSPRITADNRAMLFYRERHGTAQRLFLAFADENGSFTDKPLPLPVNGRVQSPMLSRDGRTLYFASDMPGGHGGWDLWQIQRVPKAGAAASDSPQNTAH